MGPHVSVLLPVRNAERTLPACLDSIRRQRGVSWECIAVDDGSTDASLQCLEAAATRDPRIRVLPEPARGIVAALNRGLAACTGRYVARMDADDVMHRDRLRLQAAALDARPELAGVGCHVRLFPRAGLGLGQKRYEAWLNSLDGEAAIRRDAFVECPLAHPTWMLRRVLYEQHGYRARGWPEDYDLLLRLLGAGQRLGTVPRRLLLWREAPGRLSRTSADYGLERFTACKAHFLSQGLLREAPRYVLWGYGDTGRSLARALLAHGKSPCAIVEVHPGRLGQRILHAPVIAPHELPASHARHPQPPIVVSVARAEPRALVRAALDGMGFSELRDYVCAA